jgi:hypothetical protein
MHNRRIDECQIVTGELQLTLSNLWEMQQQNMRQPLLLFVGHMRPDNVVRTWIRAIVVGRDGTIRSGCAAAKAQTAPRTSR